MANDTIAISTTSIARVSVHDAPQRPDDIAALLTLTVRDGAERPYALSTQARRALRGAQVDTPPPTPRTLGVN